MCNFNPDKHMSTLSRTEIAPSESCPICSNLSSQVNSLFLLGLIQGATYRCNSCGVYFRKPLPDDEAVAQYYKSRYFRYPDEIEQKMAQIQGDWLINMLQQNAVDMRSVHYTEFGAGRGWLVAFMKNHASVTTSVGYEPDRTSVDFGRKHFGIDIREGLLADAIKHEDLLTNGINVLSIVHVLEHLHAPDLVLKELKERYQTPYILIEVPDAELEGPVIELDTSPSSSIGQHFWSFTEQSLRILLEKSGYHIIVSMKDGKPDFWDSHLLTLKVWGTISDHYWDWYQNGFSVKTGMFALLKTASSCLSTGIRFRIRRFLKQSRTRLDLPVIRVLAKAKP
jgi:SAM-dependent methyltransferase